MKIKGSSKITVRVITVIFEMCWSFITRRHNKIDGRYKVKGIVHPKMKILSLITHHHVIPIQTHKTFVDLWHTNEDMFDKMGEIFVPP